MHVGQGMCIGGDLWIGGSGFVPVNAQGTTDAEQNLRIDAVDIEIANPTPDASRNDRIIDQVRRHLALFSGDRFAPDRIDLALARTARSDEPHRAVQWRADSRLRHPGFRFTITIMLPVD